MKIVFYSSSSNSYQKENFEITIIPSLEKQWQNFCQAHKEDEFYTVSQGQAMFMPQGSNNFFLEDQADVKAFVRKIKELKADLAIALSFWVRPYDWLTVKDAMIADSLKELGIKTICHPQEAALICFDKYKTMNFLEAKGFNHAPGFLVDHELFFCAQNQPDVIENLYKEAVFDQLRKAQYPLIIKNPVGLSSYGMTVVNNFDQAYAYLNSKKNNSSRLIEEYIQGRQFGAEIYGFDGKYTVMPPFSLSVNQYGITSPKLCRKEGPLTDQSDQADQSYKLDQLYSELTRLAGLLKLQGPAQVDLVWGGGKWYIIEINPRLSGMTTTYAAAAGMNLYEYIYTALFNSQSLPARLKKVVNKKIPLQTKEELIKLKADQNVLFISQIKNLAALQERERGYCELICREAF